MQHGMDERMFYNRDVFESDDLWEANRFFEWALSYERKGLKIAADALREEGCKSFGRYLSRSESM
jgi:hypothetical protein